MREKLTTIFGLISAIGTAGAAACVTQGYVKMAGTFFVIAAVAQAGHGYFTNKQD